VNQWTSRPVSIGHEIRPVIYIDFYDRLDLRPGADQSNAPAHINAIAMAARTQIIEYTMTILPPLLPLAHPAAPSPVPIMPAKNAMTRQGTGALAGNITFPNIMLTMAASAAKNPMMTKIPPG